jgi:hypothetical protein
LERRTRTGTGIGAKDRNTDWGEEMDRDQDRKGIGEKEEKVIEEKWRNKNWREVEKYGKRDC